MPSSIDNDGNQPFTQTTRDVMAASDHDQLVRHSVMLQTILEGQARLENQIKDLITGQAQALATWEATSKAVHDTQDSRIRKLEDIGTLWVPKGIAYETEKLELLKRIEALENNNNKFAGGWKIVVIITGTIMGILSFIYMISQIICNISCHVIK